MVKIAPSGRLVHRQGEVAAALGRAVVAKTIARLEILTAELAATGLRSIENIERRVDIGLTSRCYRH